MRPPALLNHFVASFFNHLPAIVFSGVGWRNLDQEMIDLGLLSEAPSKADTTTPKPEDTTEEDDAADSSYTRCARVRITE
jgi:hypothetical protein